MAKLQRETCGVMMRTPAYTEWEARVRDIATANVVGGLANPIPPPPDGRDSALIPWIVQNLSEEDYAVLPLTVGDVTREEIGYLAAVLGLERPWPMTTVNGGGANQLADGSVAFASTFAIKGFKYLVCLGRPVPGAAAQPTAPANRFPTTSLRTLIQKICRARSDVSHAELGPSACVGKTFGYPVKPVAANAYAPAQGNVAAHAVVGSGHQIIQAGGGERFHRTFEHNATLGHL
eukprot:3475862-Amphidinium_carterae.1